MGKCTPTVFLFSLYYLSKVNGGRWWNYLCAAVSEGNRSKSLLLPVLAGNTSSCPVHGSCNALVQTICQIRIELAKIKHTIQEQAEEVNFGRPNDISASETEDHNMRSEIVNTDDENVGHRGRPVNWEKSEDVVIKTEPLSPVREEEDQSRKLEAENKSECVDGEVSENGDCEYATRNPPVLVSRSGRKIKRKFHHDELEAGENKQKRNKIRKNNEYERNVDKEIDEDYKVLVNFAEQIGDVNLNSTVNLKKIEESEIKQTEKSSVQVTRSGRKIKKKVWLDEMDDIPTAESEDENELSDEKPDEISTTSEFTESEDDTDDDDDDPDFSDDASVLSTGETASKKRIRFWQKPVKYDRSVAIPCALCDRTVKNKRYLQMHMKYMHKRSKNVLKCSQCRDLFGTEAELNEHVYEKHEKVVEKKKREPLKGPRVSCSACDKSFPLTHKYKLSYHIRKSHMEVSRNCEKMQVLLFV